MSKAYKVYIFLSVTTSGLFQMVFTVSMLYFVTVAKLDPLQLVLVGTALEAAVFLFEIPTGVVADVYSRRLSIITGMFLLGAGFILEGLLPAFVPLLISQVLWGVGYTFTSGATQAWITDEIGEEKANPAFMHAAQLSQFGALAGIGVGTVLGNVSIQIPILLGGALFILTGLLLTSIMPETGFHPTPPGERNTFQHMAATLRSGLKMVRIRPALAGILAIGLLFGIYSEGYDRLWTAFILERFRLPDLFGASQVTLFGLIAAVSMLLTALATGILQRRVNLSQTRQVAGAIAACSVALVACLFLFPFSGSLWLAVSLIWLISVLRDVINPLYTAWVNHRLDSQVRATVISMSSLVDALGQIGGGPLVGGVAKRFGLPAGLLTSASLLAPVLLLFGWQLRAPEIDRPENS